MGRMHAIVVTLFSSTAAQLSAPDPRISFGPSHNRAVLRATCEADLAQIGWVKPRNVYGLPAHSDNVTIEFLHVARTCAGLPLDAPCVPHDESIPDLFYCQFTGKQGSAVVGPVGVYPYQVYDVSGSDMMGTTVRATCHWPEYEKLVSITGYTGNGDHVAVNVTALFGGPDAASAIMHIAYNSRVAGGNTVHVHDLPMPPAPALPPTPPQPPAPPPPADPVYVVGGSYPANNNAQLQQYCPSGKTYKSHACGSNADCGVRGTCSPQYGPFTSGVANCNICNCHTVRVKCQ